MLNSENIINQIHDDAPCVYDIMHELVYPSLRGNYPSSSSSYTWDDYFEQNPQITRPTAEQLLEELHHYDGDNWDVHYWSGRYAQMLEQDKKNNTPIRVPLTEEDLQDLSSGQTFHWLFDGVNLFIFNTDENPELDPDSDEYDPSISI